jgi:hypothetical protein
MGKYPILYAEFMNKRTYFKQLCAKNRHLKKLRAEPFLEAELINSQPNLVRLRTHNQNMTVAASAIAERKTVGDLS